VNDKDPAVTPSLSEGNGLSERAWAYEDFTADDDRPADFATGLVSLEFIKAAIRRSARFWCAMAVVGFVIGLGVYVAAPPPYQASTTLVLNDIVPGAQPGTAILDDQAVAQSRMVAALAVHKLGLRQSVGSFLAAYTATVVSPSLLRITVNATSSNDAVSRANAVARAYLQFRTDQLETQQQLLLTSLDQDINRAEQSVQSIRKQISQLQAQPASPRQQTRLISLHAALNQATTDLTALKQNTASTRATTQANTATQIKKSGVLDPAAPVPHPRLKPLFFHGAFGLIAGLALGLGIVIVRALVSDRLRRRDDVAYALGAPVMLSVGTVRLNRWLPGRRGLAAARGRDIRRIVAHLRTVVSTSSRRATLAVVPLDNPRVAALSLTSLAVSCAHEGKQVVLADLVSGAPAARLVGAGKPGIRPVRVDGDHLVVAVPGRNNVVPVGPLQQISPLAQPAKASETLAAAHASAELLLTLATLDPSVGGENLATWADDAVVVVTAGRSSWTKIHAVGEMVRLAGMRLVSAVLVGADKTDESLGMTHTPEADRDAEVAEEGLPSGGGISRSQSTGVQGPGRGVSHNP